jgi:Na+-translocating ferredoxin:NAD+ oxidoreductase RNF subunit RnfB
VRYEIDVNACKGCTLCAKNCPVDAVTGEKKKVHTINQEICVKCGKCFESCKFEAVTKN